MRVDFPDGQWADIYTVDEMPRRVMVRMEDMLAETDMDATGFVAQRELRRMRDTLMAMLVRSWSYDFERTGNNREDVYELPEASHEKLKEETREHWEKAGFTDTDSTEKEEETKPAAKKTAKTISSA